MGGSRIGSVKGFERWIGGVKTEKSSVPDIVRIRYDTILILIRYDTIRIDTYNIVIYIVLDFHH